MHGLVIDVRAQCGRNVVASACAFTNLTEVFLLVSNEMLRRSDDSRTLDSDGTISKVIAATVVKDDILPLDGRSDQLSSQVWVRRESFPVATTLRCATQWATDGSQLNIDTLASEFFTHSHTPGTGQVTTPGRCDIHTGRESGGSVCASDAKRRILQAERWKAESRYGSNIADTSFTSPAARD